MRPPDLILILFTNFLWFLLATCLLRALVRRRSVAATQRQAEDPLALEPASAGFRAATAAAPDLAEWPSTTQDAVSTEPLGVLLAAPLPELDEPGSGASSQVRRPPGPVRWLTGPALSILSLLAALPRQGRPEPDCFPRRSQRRVAG